MNLLPISIFKIFSTSVEFSVMAYRETPNWDDAWSSA